MRPASRHLSILATAMFLACAAPPSKSPPRTPASAIDEALPRASATLSPVAAAFAVAAEPVPVVRAPIWATGPQARPRAVRECPQSAAPAVRVSTARGERPEVTVGGAFEAGCPHTLGADLGASERAPGGFPAPASELMSIFRVDW
jgi:hypothetical protein